jgi:hypothetical protein
MYIVTRIDGQESYVTKDGEIGYIPMNPSNRYYRKYLEWLDEGNAPTYEDITTE